MAAHPYSITGLRQIHLKQAAPLIIIIDKACFLRNHFSKTACSYYINLSQTALFFHFTNNVFSLSNVTINKTTLHTCYRIFCQNILRLSDFDFRKLCCLLPKSIRRSTDSRRSYTSDKSSIFCDQIICCCCSKINDNNRSSIKLISCNGIYNAVCTCFFRICCRNTDSCADSRPNNNRS